MRALSERQARTCENACKPRCRCRCGGAAHGSARGGAGVDRSFFERLPEDDPHRLPTDEEKKARDKKRRREAAAIEEGIISDAQSDFWAIMKESGARL